MEAVCVVTVDNPTVVTVISESVEPVLVEELYCGGEPTVVVAAVVLSGTPPEVMN